MFSNKTPWIVLLLLWMAGSTWWHVCKIKLLCADDAPPAVAATAPAVMTPALQIADGTRLSLNSSGNFSFAKSGAEPNFMGVQTDIDSLANYLKVNPDRLLTVTGYYRPDEQNATTFANLGLARADAIKQYLVKAGVPAAAILTNAVELDDLALSAKGDSVLGGLNFGFGELAVKADTTTTAPVAATATEQSLAEEQTFTSVFKPIDLYFPTGEARYIKTDDTDKFFAEAAAYLAKNKDKTLRLTGHTDNVGSDRVNRELSIDRANAVKAQLRKSGITTGQIKAEGKGEANPKATNDTPAGRRANRRVTVVVE